MNEIKLRSAEREDAAALYTLMRQIHAAMEKKELFVCLSLEEIENILSDNGFGVVAENDKKEAVGFFLVYYPKDREDNLGRDIGLPKEELQKVAHMEAAMVHPAYRGRHLQEKMLLLAEERMKGQGYRYLLATVSPDNPASFKTLERCGYRCLMTREKYGGLLRRIYAREME